ncbi:MAG: c-type cytochrome [Burkholderiales bacterium]
MRRSRRVAFLAAAAAAAFVSTAALAQEEKLVPGPGVGLTQQKCQICHELGHVTRSRLSRGEWADNLKNMRERGAPLTDAELEIILNYLAAYYSRDPAPPAAPDTLAAAAAATGAPQHIQALLDANACSACHGLDNRVIGPSFREIAQRYAGEGGAAARLASKIRSGGQGVWGQVPMPPAPALSDSDLGKLVEWVLGQR